MRKVIVLLLSMILIFGLAACGGNEGSNGNGESNGDVLKIGVIQLLSLIHI